MAAIPVAAAAPLKNFVGMLHKGGLAALTPALTSTSEAITAIMLAELAANTRPVAATAQAMATCQVRSSLRSECLAHKIMTMTAAIGGKALSKPVCIELVPNSEIIKGAQIPSVYKPAEVPK